MHASTLLRCMSSLRKKLRVITQDQSMNAVATGNPISERPISEKPISEKLVSGNVMPIAAPNHAAKLITRELTLQRNRNRVLAASQQDLLNEIARLRQENTDLERIACIDNLTGIFNRHMLMQEIRRSMNSFQRYSTPAVMLLIDLNGFKQINDEFGHAAGDKALQAVAEHLAASIRATDCVARFGGDEFVLILNNTATNDALRVAEKLYCGAPIVDFNGASGVVQKALRYAIGHATLNGDIGNADAWLQAADLAMYRTKFFERRKQ